MGQSSLEKDLESFISEHESADIVFGGAYSIKSYYMESDNPRQMRGASQLLVDLVRASKDPEANPNASDSEIQALQMIKTVEELLKEKGGALCMSAGASFLGLVPEGCGAAVARKCEERFQEYTVTASVAVVSREVSDCSTLRDKTEFPKLLNQLHADFERRRFIKYPSIELHWNRASDPLFPLPNTPCKESKDHIKTESYIEPITIHEPQKRKSQTEKVQKTEEVQKKTQDDLCDRCRLRDIKFRAKLSSEGEFYLCPSCAHKEFWGCYAQRNRFRNECAEFAKDIRIKLAPPSKGESVAEPGKPDSNPLWFGTTTDYADRDGDIALIYADINNLGGALRKLSQREQGETTNAAQDVSANPSGTVQGDGDAENSPGAYTIQQYCAFHNAVTCTVQNSLYSALAKSVKTLYDAQGGLFPTDWSSGQEYPTRFEIIAAGGDDICVIVPGAVALLAGTLLMEEFERLWEKEGRKKEFGFDLTLSAGIAIGQAQTPIHFMHDVTEQLLGIAKRKAHELEESDKPQSVLDIQVLNSEAQWATSVEGVLRKKLVKTEGSPPNESTAKLTQRPFSKKESRDLLQLIDVAKSTAKVSASTLHNIVAALKQCGIAEGDLWFDFLLSRQSSEDQSETGETGDLQKLTHEIVNKILVPKGIRAGCKLYYSTGGSGLAKQEFSSPWYDIAELYGQIGGKTV
jgi:hypothetical protein